MVLRQKRYNHAPFAGTNLQIFLFEIATAKPCTRAAPVAWVPVLCTLCLALCRAKQAEHGKAFVPVPVS